MQSTVRPGRAHPSSSPLPARHPTTTHRPEVGTAYAQPTNPAGVLSARNRLTGRKWGWAWVFGTCQTHIPISALSVTHWSTSLCSLESQLLHLLNGHRIGARVNLKPGSVQPTMTVEFSSVYVAVWDLNPGPAHSGKHSSTQLPP